MTARTPVEPLPSFEMRAIGRVRTPFTEKSEAPRQPAAARDVEGVIELDPDPRFADALSDLDGFSHLWVVFVFDRNLGVAFRPKVLPPRSSGQRRGVLATRSPHRPNPIGISVVRLDRVEGTRVFVRDVDMLDGTPVLDLKPYVAYADSVPDARAGWLDDAPAPTASGEASAPNDPRSAWEVVFEPRADEALAWLAASGGPDLRARAASALALGPTPHAYRRIRREGDAYVLAVKDFRVRFRVEGRRVHVYAVATGYRPAELASASDGPLALHRELARRFGA